MSIRTLIQICISLIIFLIIGWVYFEYFNTNKKIVEEIVPLENNINQLEKKISDLGNISRRFQRDSKKIS